MKLRRILALLLAGILVSASFLSCSSDEKEQNAADGTETTDAAQTETGADEIDFSNMSFLERVRYANAGVEDGLPEKNYGGREVMIHTVTPHPTELTGDVVNDARYQQNLNVEDRFNVKISYFNLGFQGWDGYVQGLKNLFIAGDDFCDLLVNWDVSTAANVLDGFYEDLSQYSAIDATKPWYFGDEMNLYGYKGHMYVATGMMDVQEMTGRVECFFFNKEIAKDYNMDDFYSVVRDGKWTLDYVKNIVKDFYYDLDGDGAESSGDLYGMSYARAGSWTCTLGCFGLPQCDMDKDGKPFLTVFNRAEEAQALMDSMKELVSYKGSRTLSDWDYETFVSGNALLCASYLGTLPTFRDTDVNYGILPRFKLNEQEEFYYTSNLPNPWAIPITASDKEMSAVLLTAIASEGYREVLPSYYETAMKSKFSTDEESGEMLDLMLQHIRADGMFIYGVSNYVYNLWNYFDSNQGFASYWESKRSGLESTMNDALERISALSD